MIPQLPKELSEALDTNGADGLEVIDPETGQQYVIVDGETYRQALDALRERRAREAIAEGLAQMEAGEGRPAEEAFDVMREQLGFPLQQ